MTLDDMVERIGDLPLTVLASRVCPVCLGSGDVWLSEYESNWLGTSVRCWHCYGSGRMYTSTEVES